MISPNVQEQGGINMVVIYNNRNRSNDTTESQKEKNACFNAQAGGK